jgi:hypothetical protein
MLSWQNYHVIMVTLSSYHDNITALFPLKSSLIYFNHISTNYRTITDKSKLYRAILYLAIHNISKTITIQSIDKGNHLHIQKHFIFNKFILVFQIVVASTLPSLSTQTYRCNLEAAIMIQHCSSICIVLHYCWYDPNVR